MFKKLLIIPLLLSLTVCLVVRSNVAYAQSFQDFVKDIKQQAIKKGFSEKVVNKAFRDVKQLEFVTHHYHHQFQKEHTFKTYRKALVSAYRIKTGKEKLKQHAQLLDAISKKYQVPKEVIISLWGLESSFGAITGDTSEFTALTTLAYTSQRKRLFIAEIFAALTMVQDRKVPLEHMKGSWAGAMGQCQFMPASYLRYAESYKHDGPPNIWTNLPDVFASIANFLRGEGFNAQYPILFNVKLTRKISPKSIGLQFKQSITHWLNEGIKSADSKKLFKQKGLYSLILPDGEKGSAYLVNWQNFHAIMRWNSATYYAISVALLANELSTAAAD